MSLYVKRLYEKLCEHHRRYHGEPSGLQKRRYFEEAEAQEEAEDRAEEYGNSEEED